MVKASEIRDEGQFVKWLETQEDETVAAIFSRAALRGLHASEGMHSELYEFAPDFMRLVLLPHLIPFVAAFGLDEEIQSVAINAETRGLFDRDCDIALQAVAAAGSPLLPGNLSALSSFESDTDAAALARRASLDDAIVVEELGVSGLMTSPLWTERNVWWSYWEAVRTEWSLPGSPYTFWLRWYESLLDPVKTTPINPDLLREIVLIDEKKWTGENAPEVIAVEIEALETKYALAATPYGEEIIVDQATGKQRVEPRSDLPDDLAAYALRKLQGAVDLFGDDLGDQYSALRPDLDLITRTVAANPTLPVEVYDHCRSLAVRLKTRCENGELPKPAQDALIADYEMRIVEVATDIFANDPTTQEVKAKRDAIAGTDVLAANAQTIIEGVEELIPITEGVLAEDLSRDAEAAVDPTLPEEERKSSAHRLASRVFRISGNVVKVIYGAASGAVSATATIGGAWSFYQMIANSPGVRELVLLIRIWIGV